MTNMLIMKGRRVSPGKVEGTALVTKQRIGFNFGVDTNSGIIVERGHELEGKSIKDVILVFPAGKGSTGGSFMIYQLARRGTGPKAMINEKTETIVAVGAVMGKIPVVDRLDKNPLELIENGDRVEVDADNGTVKVWKLDHKS
jgi:hypothetical protein